MEAENHKMNQNKNDFYEEKILPADNKRMEVPNGTSEKVEKLIEIEEISSLEELEDPEETMPFSFIPLAASETALSELGTYSSDTIIQNSDGTFSIADKSAYNSDKGIDQNFKRLVDSVLKN